MAHVTGETSGLASDWLWQLSTVGLSLFGLVGVVAAEYT